MRIEHVHIEYSEISEDESDELLRQVYDLLLSDPGVVKDGPSLAPETGYNKYARQEA